MLRMAHGLARWGRSGARTLRFNIDVRFAALRACSDRGCVIPAAGSAHGTRSRAVDFLQGWLFRARPLRFFRPLSGLWRWPELKDAGFCSFLRRRPGGLSLCCIASCVPCSMIGAHPRRFSKSRLNLCLRGFTGPDGGLLGGTRLLRALRDCGRRQKEGEHERHERKQRIGRIHWRLLLQFRSRLRSLHFRLLVCAALRVKRRTKRIASRA